MGAIQQTDEGARARAWLIKAAAPQGQYTRRSHRRHHPQPPNDRHLERAALAEPALGRRRLRPADVDAAEPPTRNPLARSATDREEIPRSHPAAGCHAATP